MPNTPIQLPAGFTLDDAQQQPSVKLPAGFTLDSAKPAQPAIDMQAMTGGAPIPDAGARMQADALKQAGTRMNAPAPSVLGQARQFVGDTLSKMHGKQDITPMLQNIAEADNLAGQGRWAEAWDQIRGILPQMPVGDREPLAQERQFVNETYQQAKDGDYSGATANLLTAAMANAEHTPAVADAGKAGVEAVKAAAPEVAAQAVDAVKRGADAVGETASGLRNGLADRLNDSADKNYETALHPTTKVNKALTQDKVAPGLRDRGVMATSLKNLQEKAQDHMADLGAQIDDAFEQHAEAGTKVSAKPILQRLQAEKQNYIVDGVPINEAYVNRVDALQAQISDVAAKNGGQIPLSSLRRIRQIHDETIARSKGGFALAPDDASGVSALKTYTDAIRGTVADTDPELADLNKEFSFWKNVDQVADASLLRKTGQRAPLTQKFGELLGGTVGGHMAGYGGGMVGAKIGGSLGKLQNSMLWNSLKAQTKAKIANLLATGDEAGAAEQFVNAVQQELPQRSAPGMTPQEAAANYPDPEAPKNPENQPEITQVVVPRRGLPANVIWQTQKKPVTPITAEFAQTPENVQASSDAGRSGSDLRHAAREEPGRVPDAGESDQPPNGNAPSKPAGGPGGLKPKSGAQLEAERIMADAKAKAKARKAKLREK